MYNAASDRSEPDQPQTPIPTPTCRVITQMRLFFMRARIPIDKCRTPASAWFSRKSAVYMWLQRNVRQSAITRQSYGHMHTASSSESLTISIWYLQHNCYEYSCCSFFACFTSLTNQYPLCSLYHKTIYHILVSILLLNKGWKDESQYYYACLSCWCNDVQRSNY